MSAHLPFNHSEVDLQILKHVDRLVEELGVEEVAAEDDRGKTDPSLQRRGLPLGLLNVLHVLLVMLTLLLSQLAKLAYVLVLLGKLPMSADNGIGDLRREVDHAVYWERGIALGHLLHKLHQL